VHNFSETQCISIIYNIQAFTCSTTRALMMTSSLLTYCQLPQHSHTTMQKDNQGIHNTVTLTIAAILSQRNRRPM